MPSSDSLTISEDPQGQLDWIIGVCRNVGTPDRTNQFAVQFGNSVGAHLAKRAILNAPVKTGMLRKSIVFTGLKQTGARTYRGAVQVHGTVFWAGLMHAYLDPHAQGPNPLLGRTYRLGTISRGQPPTPEGGVGGQYVLRVANYHFKDYESGLSRAWLYFVDTGKIPRIKFRGG